MMGIIMIILIIVGTSVITKWQLEETRHYSNSPIFDVTISKVKEYNSDNGNVGICSFSISGDEYRNKRVMGIPDEVQVGDRVRVQFKYEGNGDLIYYTGRPSNFETLIAVYSMAVGLLIVAVSFI